VCEFARKELGFDYLVDISSLDNYGEDRAGRSLSSARPANGCELRVKADVSEEKSELPTVIGVWRTANWHEREIYDMMASGFAGIPICADFDVEGYPYFPLRKDFPLAGKPTQVPEIVHPGRAARRRTIRNCTRR